MFQNNGMYRILKLYRGVGLPTSVLNEYNLLAGSEEMITFKGFIFTTTAKIKAEENA